MLGCKGLFERCAPLFYIILHSRRLIILSSAYVFFKEIFKRFFLRCFIFLFVFDPSFFPICLAVNFRCKEQHSLPRLHSIHY